MIVFKIMPKNNIIDQLKKDGFQINLLPNNPH